MNFIANETAQKLRGGYYTPLDLAGFCARWVATNRPKDILEPSCGDGAFFRAFGDSGHFREARIQAFELDVAEALKARHQARKSGLNATVLASDFLSWALSEFRADGQRFDAVVGNPPFIRYQYLPAHFQDRAEQVFERLDCKFTKHTNAWVPFILACIELLRPGGRLAMVVPSEIVHVMHAQSLRTYLGTQCRRIVLIDPQEIWFEDTLQGAVILLAEKARRSDEHREGLGLVSVVGREFIERDPEDLFRQPRALNGKTVEGKWTRAFLSPEVRQVLDEVSLHENVHLFKQIADVDVGIVTGANKFFLVEDSVVETYGLENWAHPMFGRSEHCPGVIYDKQQHRENAKKRNPTNFIWFKDNSAENNVSAKRYIELGERQDLHKRYKCRVRSPWYSVPSVYSSEIGMLKRAHDAPRLLLNKLGAYTTDTAYRIRSKGATAGQLVSAFLNPLTALSAELEGRHYGGGVLELVPSEIERLLIPLPTSGIMDVEEVDKAVRTYSLDHVIATIGTSPLHALGLGKREIDILLQGWRSLRARRHRISDDAAD